MDGEENFGNTRRLVVRHYMVLLERLSLRVSLPCRPNFSNFQWHHSGGAGSFSRIVVPSKVKRETGATEEGRREDGAQDGPLPGRERGEGEVLSIVCLSGFCAF